MSPFLQQLRGIAVCLVILLALSYIPWGSAPSLDGWIRAYIRGNGKPHFPIPGTPESRIEDFFQRHPERHPQWHTVPQEVNGFLLLREFVESDAASKPALTDELREMLLDENKWDQNAARQHVEKSREELNELRRIALLPQRSAQGRAAGEIIDARQYKLMSDSLLLSYKQHLYANLLADAFTDFTALYGFSAHVDRHEVPNLLDKTIGILIRLSAHDALCEFLNRAPADTDWSPWIRLLEDEPSYEKQMEAAWRGELWSGIHRLQNGVIEENGNNPIWDFTAFEDAYAAQMEIYATTFAHATTLTDLNQVNILHAGSVRQEASLSKAARTMLDRLHEGVHEWCRGAIRGHARSHFTLAALQLLQSEREEVPISSADDPRLSSLAIDPSNGMPFIFDPTTRTLSAAKASALQGEEPIQLPPR